MFALALLTTLCADPGPNASRLAVIRPMPDFTLTTQADAPLRTVDLRGKVVLVSFSSSQKPRFRPLVQKF